MMSHEAKPSRPTPYPGDGVCPSSDYFQKVRLQSYSSWTSFSQQSLEKLHTANCFLDLLNQIPSFFAPSFSIQYNPPQVEFILQWETTDDPTCEQPVKRSHHYLTLGILAPKVYVFEDGPIWSVSQTACTSHFSILVFAWTYILSSRWVEILKSAGEKAFLLHNQEIDGDNIWSLIVGQEWQATVVCGEKTFFAPWSLTNHTKKPW